jgi:hypothetical protein
MRFGSGILQKGTLYVVDQALGGEERFPVRALILDTKKWGIYRALVNGKSVGSYYIVHVPTMLALGNMHTLQNAKNFLEVALATVPELELASTEAEIQHLISANRAAFSAATKEFRL